MRLFAVAAAIALAQLAQGCKSCRSESGTAPGANASASAAMSTALPTVPSALPPRRPPPAQLAQRHRRDVLDAILRAREAIAQDKPRNALVTLAKVTRLDPTGAALAVELSRAAAAAKDTRRARNWALRAIDRSFGNASVASAAQQALEAVDGKPRPAVRPSSSTAVPTFEAACQHLVDEVERGKSLALGLGQANVTDVGCVVGHPQSVGGPRRESVAELRVTIAEGGRTEASWVGLRTPRGVVAQGPVARVHTPAGHDVTNAYTVRLGHLDALDGGEREVSVGIDERLSQVDVALNELFAVDRTRVVVLTLDRGGATASPSIVTSELRIVRMLDRHDNATLAGYEPSELLNSPKMQRFRLRWGDNEVELTSQSDAKDPTRRIRLFE